MASLIPCPACRRHVRRHETECRFCGAQLNTSGALLREILIPRDAKRATIFALGMTLAGQACGGESTAIPVYGAPSVDGGTGGVNGGNGGTGAAPNNSGGNGNEGSIQAVYGAPAPPVPTGGSGGSTGMPGPSPSFDAGGDDAGQSDAAPEDAGN